MFRFRSCPSADFYIKGCFNLISSALPSCPELKIARGCQRDWNRAGRIGGNAAKPYVPRLSGTEALFFDLSAFFPLGRYFIPCDFAPSAARRCFCAFFIKKNRAFRKILGFFAIFRFSLLTFFERFWGFARKTRKSVFLFLRKILGTFQIRNSGRAGLSVFHRNERVFAVCSNVAALLMIRTCYSLGIQIYTKLDVIS